MAVSYQCLQRRAGQASILAAEEAVNALARFTAALPGGAGDWSLGKEATALIYALFLLVTLLLGCREAKKELPLRL